MKRNVNFMEITARQCKAFLDKGNEIVFVPCASPERLGRHLPLGERIIVAETVAEALAEKHNGLALPIIPYGTLYEGYEGKGSVDLPATLMHRYVYDVCMELVRGGFRHITVVGFADELYYLPQDMFQMENIAVTALSPDGFARLADSVAQGLDAHGLELWRFAACLLKRGDRDTLNDVMERNERFYTGVEAQSGSAREAMRSIGNAPHVFAADAYKFQPVSLGKSLGGKYTPPTEDTYAQALAELDRWLDSYAAAIPMLAAYQQYLDTRDYVRPI